MSKTAFATTDSETRKLWNEALFRDWQKESYFNRFMGNEMSGLVLSKTELTKQQGDEITFTLIPRLTGDGVTEGVTLEGNEESLDKTSFSVVLEENAHAVRDRGPLDRQRPGFSIDKVSDSAIRVWGAEKIDQKCFDAMDTSPRVVFYTTSDGASYNATSTLATAKTAIDSNESITLDLISYLKTWARTGGDRSQTPIKPVMVEGKPYYILLTHPDALWDLKTSSEWKQAQRDAAERGSKNPLFTGARAIWDGVVIHDHENVTVGSDAGSGGDVAYCQSHFMGQGALSVAWGQRPNVVSETFDYGREHGFGVTMMMAAKKPQFSYSGTTRDYGTVMVMSARTNVGGVTVS